MSCPTLKNTSSSPTSTYSLIVTPCWVFHMICLQHSGRWATEQGSWGSGLQRVTHCIQWKSSLTHTLPSLQRVTCKVFTYTLPSLPRVKYSESLHLLTLSPPFQELHTVKVFTYSRSPLPSCAPQRTHHHAQFLGTETHQKNNISDIKTRCGLEISQNI